MRKKCDEKTRFDYDFVSPSEVNVPKLQYLTISKHIDSEISECPICFVWGSSFPPIQKAKVYGEHPHWIECIISLFTGHLLCTVRYPVIR